jgi:hypothetical protein
VVLRGEEKRRGRRGRRERRERREGGKGKEGTGDGSRKRKGGREKD